jgi:hypothetical protein
MIYSKAFFGFGFFFLSSTCFGQLGVRAGLGVSWHNLSNSEMGNYIQQYDSYSQGPTFSYDVGLNYKKPLSELITTSLELNFSRVGSREQSTFISTNYLNPDSVWTMEDDIHLWWNQISSNAVVHVGLNQNLLLVVGGQVGYKIKMQANGSSKSSLNYLGELTSEEKVKFSNDIQIHEAPWDDFYQKITFGFIIGASYELNEKIGVELRATQGLNNMYVNDEVFASLINFKTIQAQFAVNYKLKRSD